MRTHLVLAVVLAALAQQTAARTVNACQWEREGGGTNLEQAVASGGRVDFNCPPGSVIEVRQTIDVPQSVVIDGNDRVTLRSQLPQAAPAFDVAAGARFEARRLRLLGTTRAFLGNAPADFADLVRASQAAVHLRHVEVSGSTRPVRASELLIEDSRLIDGGAGPSATSARIVRSRFERNFSGVDVNGGLLEILDSTFVDHAMGAVEVAGAGCVLRMRRALLERNGARIPRSALVIDGCSAEIAGSQFRDNRGIAGGALAITAPRGPVNVLVRHTDFERNTATDAGGAIVLGGTGAIDLKLRNSSLAGNGAGFGGAVAATSMAATPTLSITRSVFTGNTAATHGGALALRNAFLVGSQVLLNGNTASTGGALYAAGLDGSSTLLVNSIVAGNTATIGSAAAFNAFFESLNSTISGNNGVAISGDISAADMQFVRDRAASVTRRFTLRNTIVAGNAGGNCGLRPAGETSLQFPGADCGQSVESADPQIDNMFVPMPGGAAFARAATQPCLEAPVAAVDFYGQRRPRSARCSIGAVEGDIDRIVGATRSARELSVARPVPWRLRSRTQIEEPDSQ